MNRRDFLRMSAFAGTLPLFNIGCAGFGRRSGLRGGEKARIAIVGCGDLAERSSEEFRRTLRFFPEGGRIPDLPIPSNEELEVEEVRIVRRNLDNVLPSAQMRGWNLYVLKKRGVFPNTLSRVAKKGGGWALENLKLTPGQVEEIDARLKFAGIE